MKKNKFIGIILVFAVMIGVTPVFAAYTDIDDSATYLEAAYRLSDLDILSGYEDGTFRPYESVTRAQVAKMIVCVMDKEDVAKTRGYSSRFFDVPDGHWAVPYINYAAQNGILKGYADGSFGPEREVTYAELSAILLRMLKYNEEDLGYRWPENYTIKATSLGWNQGVDVTSDSVLTRAMTAMIIDDALFTKINPNITYTSQRSSSYSSDSSMQTQETGANTNSMNYENQSNTEVRSDSKVYTGEECLISLYDKEVLEDALLMALPEDDSSLSKNEVSILLEDDLSGKSDTYKTDVTYKNYTAGEMFSHIVIDPDNDHILAMRRYKKGEEGSKAALFATINRVVGDQIEYVGENGVKDTITLDAGFVTYVDFSKSTYSLNKSRFTEGRNITFYGEEYGDWDFVVINSLNEVKPTLATKDYTDSDNYLEGIKINHDNLTVYRNGKTAVLSDIAVNDVVYYNTKTNIMDVYTKKITGIYYDAKPTKAYVTTVTVGGKDYTIGNIAATTKLDATNGAYEIGDRITLLLGKNDEVVFVSDVTGFNSMDYGVVLSTGTKIKEVGEDSGKAEYVVNMFMPDGNTYEYVTDKLYNSYEGMLVKISNSGGQISLTGVNATNGFGGTIDKTAKTIAGKKVTNDTVIIQRINGADGKIKSAEILNFDTLSVSNIYAEQVKNVVNANGFGDLGILYVEELTDSSYQYGVLMSKKQTGEMMTYIIYKDGIKSTYMSGYNSMATAGPVMFRIENGQLQEVKGLNLYESASKYSAIDETRILINQNTYDIDPAVKIFRKTNTNNYEEKSFSDLKGASINSISIYSNVSKKNSGVIKVIVYTSK